MRLTINSDDKLDRVIAVVEAMYDVKLQQVGSPGGGEANQIPDDGGQGASKPRHD